MAYRIFVTEQLKLIPQEKYLTSNYEDIVTKKRTTSSKSGDELAFEVIKKNGLKFK